MEFPTLAFGYFFVATLTLAWALGPWPTVRKAFLLVASYLFCWKLQPLFLVTLVASSLANYALGEALYRLPRERRMPLVTVGVAANLALLGWFKYANFLGDGLNEVFDRLGLGAHLPPVDVIAPLGLSFYTFQAVGYLIDVYRGYVRPGSPLDFLLFQAFFPKFAAGPICRSTELIPQLMAPPPREIRDGSRAVALIVGGLLKKMVLGTYLATHMTEDAFQAPGSWSAIELWVALFAYTAQIYLDFSGYTDIARGVGLLFGIDLPENFRSPYAATNLGEYWRRWHLSLSRWLRAYVYFPLGGSRGSQARTVLNLFITFLLCGLWHGPTWGYVIWGGLHGVGLGWEKLVRDRRRARGENPDGSQTPLGHFLGWAGTLTFAALVRIPFKSVDLAHAAAFTRGLVAFGRPIHAFEPGVLVLTLVTIGLNFVGPAIFESFVALHERLSRPARLVTWMGLALVLHLLWPFDVPFTIYFRF